MNKEERLHVLDEQIQMIIKLVRQTPYFKDIGSKQISGMLRYSQAVGDISFSEQTTMTDNISKCLDEQYMKVGWSK